MRIKAPVKRRLATESGRLSEYLWAFATAFIPDDDINEVNGSQTCEKAEKGYVGVSEKQVDDHRDGNQRQTKQAYVQVG